MRLSKKQLKRIIREEMENAILEIGVGGSAGGESESLPGEETAYRQYINGLRKRKSIDKPEWRMLRRAIRPGKQYDPTTPEGKAKLDKLLRPYEQKGEKSMAARAVAKGVSMTGISSMSKRRATREKAAARAAAAEKKKAIARSDLNKLVSSKPRMNHRNNISDPQLKAKYDAKVQEIAKDKKLNATAKRVAVNPASWLKSQVFKRVNKMVVDGTLGQPTTIGTYI